MDEVHGQGIGKKQGDRVILDEIYGAIIVFRQQNLYGCPFGKPLMDSEYQRCDWCNLLFPEAVKRKTKKTDKYESNWCPCIIINHTYVKSEMRRLFP